MLSMRRWWTGALLVGLVATASVPAAARQEDEEARPAGWSWTVEDDGGRRSAGLLPKAAFALAAGEVLGPGDRPGPRALVLRTRLLVPDDGPYRFGLETEGGTARLALVDADGASRTAAPGAWLDLPYGEAELELVFDHAGGDARLRATWERGGDAPFPPEPIPSGATRAPDLGAPIVRVSDRAARVELASKGCTSCHVPSAAAAAFLDRRSGPRLERVGTRASHDWLVRWLSNPQRMRPGSGMPNLFAASEGAEVDALAHFLRSLADEAPASEGVASEPAVLDAGRRLYHTVGCVACHGALAAPAEVFGDEALPRAAPDVEVVAPFGDLAGKWFAPALARFLQEPDAVHLDGRMPSLDLSDEEADLIATYLVSRWGAGETREVNEAAAARGHDVFARKGCAACHELEGFESVPVPFGDELQGAVEGGCLDPFDRTTPRYALTGPERAALIGELVRALDLADPAPAPLDAAQRTVRSLGCLACHRVHGEGGPPAELDVFFTVLDERTDLGDEGRLPPDLSNVGWKLQTSWLHEVLGGDGRARPYMATRMPSYGAEHVDGLAEELARLDGVVPYSDAPEPEATDDLVLVGRELMGRDALGCLACHVYGDRPPTGSPGPAITGFAERLRYEWASTFLMNPQRFLPGSRMPDFGTAGRSSLARVLDGDMRRQIEAMWAYFSLGELMPPPEEVATSGGIALVVGERPIVHRGFLEQAGSRGIAVGLPVGVHYAFDAERVRLADVWRGAFLDASGSWAGRGGTVLGGQGERAWSAPAGPAVRPLGRDGTPLEGRARFRGYRLDDEGYPTFLYEVGGVDVEERVDVEVAPELRLTRRFRLRDASEVGGARVVAPGGISSVRWRPGGEAWRTDAVRPTMGAAPAFVLTFEPPVGELEIELEVLP